MNTWSVEGERGQRSMTIKINQPDLSKGLHPANKGQAQECTKKTNNQSPERVWLQRQERRPRCRK